MAAPLILVSGKDKVTGEGNLFSDDLGHPDNSANKTSSRPNTDVDTNGGASALAGKVSKIPTSLSSSMSGKIVSILPTASSGILSGDWGG